ncbi:MAG: SNF2-related protein [Lentisphaeria bacterium]
MSSEKDAMGHDVKAPCDTSAGKSPIRLLHWDQDCPNPMGRELSKQLETACQMDVLTGYFYFNGIPELYEALLKAKKAKKSFILRILVGMEAQVGTKEFAGKLVEREPPAMQSEAEVKRRYRDNLLAALGNVKSQDKTNADAGLYNLFVEMLTDQTTLHLEIKQTREPNHGKLYLFYSERQPSTYIIGSSNFSKPGLAERQELNVLVGEDKAHAKELERLFNKLWKDGSYDIIEIDPKKGSPEDQPATTPKELQERSPYRRPTPFEAYMALMKYYLGQSALEESLDKSFRNAAETAGYKPFQYQLRGAAHALRIIREHGGVIIADAVGLGKSVTAALIATQAHPGGGIIIVPPTLVDDWKNDYLDKFKLDAPGRPWAVFAMTDLAEAEKFCGENAVGMVIVDEAHRFRNPKIEGYETLKRLCLDRQVVLLTATPFNNRPADLASLMDLFAARSEKLPDQAVTVYEHICDQDEIYQELVSLERNWDRHSRPPTVEKRFKKLKEKYAASITDKKAIRAALEEIAEALFATLHPYIIRRNRSDLKENPDYFEKGRPISMPEQQVHGEYYALEPEQNEAFMGVLSVFQNSADCAQAEPSPTDNGEHTKGDTPESGFACTIYRVAEFVESDESDESDEKIGNYLDNYRSMTLRHLLRRFESSPYAFQRSIEKLLKRYKQALKDLRDPEKLYYCPQGLDDDDDNDDFATDAPKNLRYCRPGAKSSGTPFLSGQDEEFIAGLESDQKVLQYLRKQAETLVRKDSKLALLKEKIAAAVRQQQGNPDLLLGAGEALGVLPAGGAPRRVVIFTTFIDTARHLAQELAKEFGDNAVMLAIDKQQGGTEDELDLRQVNLVHATSRVNACFDVKADSANIWTAPRILVTTDKFSEGVNLNRAGLMVNYDIPWNPVRVIQRLGRFNRINACWFKTIHAYNLYPEYQRADGQGKPAGADWASAQDIAAQKLIMIHRLFFEDATILGDDTAGKERPFEQIEYEAAKGSEPASEETEVQKRYQEALRENGYTGEEAIKAFEKSLLALGVGMKTVRLAQPEANMLRFSQKGALMQAEILDELHTSDMNKRMEPIGFLEALDKIAASETDACHEPERFPDKYEEIEKRMDIPPMVAAGSTGKNGRSNRKNRNVGIIIRTWLERHKDLKDAIDRLYDAYQQGKLAPTEMDEILELKKAASATDIENFIKRLPARIAQGVLPSAASNAAATAERNTILTFVNDK